MLHACIYFSNFILISCDCGCMCVSVRGLEGGVGTVCM